MNITTSISFNHFKQRRVIVMDATVANDMTRDQILRVVYGAFQEVADRHQSIVSSGEVLGIIQDVLIDLRMTVDSLPDEIKAIHARALKFVQSSSGVVGSVGTNQLLDEIGKLLD